MSTKSAKKTSNTALLLQLWPNSVEFQTEGRTFSLAMNLIFSLSLTLCLSLSRQSMTTIGGDTLGCNDLAKWVVKSFDLGPFSHTFRAVEEFEGFKSVVPSSLCVPEICSPILGKLWSDSCCGGFVSKIGFASIWWAKVPFPNSSIIDVLAG